MRIWSYFRWKRYTRGYRKNKSAFLGRAVISNYELPKYEAAMNICAIKSNVDLSCIVDLRGKVDLKGKIDLRGKVNMMGEEIYF